MKTITFLSSRTPIQKWFSSTQTNIDKLYRTKQFTSHQESWNTIGDLHNLLLSHAKDGHTLICGGLARPIINESRTGHASDDGMYFVCLDADKISLTPEQLIERIPLFQSIGFSLHWSSSQGINPEVKPLFNYHLFIGMTGPMDGAKRNAFIKYICHTHLNDLFTLTENKSSLEYPLDLSTSSPAQMITIAPPIVEPNYTTSLTPEQRFHLHDGPLLTYESLLELDFTPESMAKLKQKRFNKLRTEEGLEKIQLRSMTKKYNNHIRVATGVVPSTLHHIDDSNGFSHYNLRDGDSGSYYHEINKPKVIHCFKAEVLPFLHEECDPESYANAVARQQEHLATSTEKIQTVAFDPNGTLLRIISDPANHTLVAEPTKEVHLKYLAAGNKYIIPDPIPHYQVVFEPKSPPIMTPGDPGTINIFSEPPLTRNQTVSSAPNYNINNIVDAFVEKCPHLAEALLHGNGGDGYFTAVELNMLHGMAVVRKKPRIAIIKHGVTGTGKDLPMKWVYGPLLGRQYIANKTITNLRDIYNYWLLTTRFLNISETHIGRNEKQLFNDMKNIVTTEQVTLRRMYQDPVIAPIITGVGFFSNDRAPLDISGDQRRFVVAPYQDEKLLTIAGIPINEDTIVDELFRKDIPELGKLIYDYEFNEHLYHTAEDTESKEQMKIDSRDSYSAALHAITHGNLGHFLASAAMVETKTYHNPESLYSITTLPALIRLLAANLDEETYVSLNTIQQLLAAILEGVPTRGKFISLLGKYQIHPEIGVFCAKENSIQPAGIPVTWTLTSQEKEILHALDSDYKIDSATTHSKISPIRK